MEPEESAPALAEPVEDATSEAPESKIPDGGSDEGREPISMAEAFARAKAARESQQSSESAPDSEADGSGDSESAKPAQETPQQRLFTEQAAIQRALDLRRQGRESELSPEARGLLRKFEEEIMPAAEQRVRTRDKEETEFKNLFLHLDSLRLTDREAFDAEVDSINPDTGRRDKLAFYYAYKDAHPEISADNPNAEPPRKSEAQIYSDVAATYGKGFEGLIDAIGRDGGVDSETMQRLKAEYRFGAHPDSENLATFGAKLITALVEAGSKSHIEREVAKVREAERKAYQLELQRVKGQQITTPRNLPGGVRDPRKPVESHGPITMAEAVRQAKESLANA